MPRPTVILFDVDGTLVSCGGAGRAAMKRAFTQLVGRDDVFEFGFGGLTDRAIVRAGLTHAGEAPSSERIDEIIACYLDFLPQELERSRGFNVLPGVVELLDELGERAALALGLGTGNVRAGAHAKLDRGGLGSRFTFGGFGCDHEDRAELLAVGADRGAAALGLERAECRVIVIGDTPRDVAAAAAIGAECLAVATGGYAREALTGAALCVDDLSLPEARAWIGQS